MTKPLMSKKTITAFQHASNSSNHSYLVEGDMGSNTKDCSDYFVSRIAIKHAIPKEHVHTIATNKSISVDSIRSLLSTLRHAKLRGNTFQRLLYIPRAEMMTHEAQNTLLKSLEEPPKDVLFILSTDQAGSLLPTIRSRCQTIRIEKVSQQEAAAHFTTYEANTLSKAYHAAGGQVAFMEQLLKGGGDSFATARSILTSKKYDRLVKVNELASNRALTSEMLAAMNVMLASLIKQSVEQSNPATTRLHIQQFKRVERAQEALAQNSNAKIILTELFCTI